MIKEKITIQKEEVSVNITNSVVDSIRFTKTNKTGFRVYDNNKIGISGIEGEYDENEMFSLAEDNLNNNIEYLAKPESNHQESLVIDEIQISDHDFIEQITKLIKKLHDKYPDIIFSHKINLIKTQQEITNDQNLKLYYQDKFYSFSIIIKEKTSANLIDMFYEGNSREYNEEKVIEDISLIVDKYKIKKDIEAGLCNVVIDFNYLSSKITSDLSALIMMNGASLFSGKIGEKVFSDKFTVYENKSPYEVMGQSFFDSEGVVNKDYRYTLIDQGKIVTPIVSKKEAIAFNLPITGSADSSYDSVPALVPSQLIVKSSEKTIKELLNGEKAIYVIMAEGGDYTPSGDYATPVQLAYLLEDGKIVGCVDGLSISGNIFDFFGNNFVGRPCDSMWESTDIRPVVVKMNVSK